jgi:succinate dehydrogenase / fumarate reductase cytochrome b subunit
MVTNAANSAEAAPDTAPNDAANDAVKACAHNPLQLHQPEPGCKCGKLRPPRKLHALVGLWLTLFMGLHLAIAVTGINPSRYQGTVNLLHRWLAYLPGAVLLLIFLPVLLQAASGLYLTAKEGMQYDIKRCDRGGKLRFFLQRWSGLAILAYLFVHIGNMRGWLPLTRHWEGVRAAAGSADGMAFSHTAFAFQPWNSPAVNSITIALLLVGIIGTVYHAANGAWSGAILWKVITTPRGIAWFGFVCAALGISLAAMGALAWYAFTLSPNVHATLSATGR